MQSHTSATPAAKRRSNNTRALIIVAVVLLIVFAWTRGTFDNMLWHVGLNYNDCAMNGFGATFCGDDLKQYQLRISR